MTCVQILLGPLSKRDQAFGKRQAALDTNQGFRPDEVAGGPEQRMPMFDGSHRDAVHLLDRAHQKLRLDIVNAVAIGTERLLAHDQSQRDRVDAKDQRPFLSHDVKQVVDAIRLHGGDHRFMNCRDSARMPACKGDKVLIGFFGSTKTLAQVRKSVVLERDHSSHAAGFTAASVNFLQRTSADGELGRLGSRFPDLGAGAIAGLGEIDELGVIFARLRSIAGQFR